MKISTILLLLFILTGCTVNQQTKIPCYAWMSGPGKATDRELSATFKDLKEKGVDGLMYSAGQEPENYRRIGKIAKAQGLKFHTWIPTLIQGVNPKLKAEWYAVNGRGESAMEKPAYADHYKFVCFFPDELQ